MNRIVRDSMGLSGFEVLLVCHILLFSGLVGLQQGVLGDVMNSASYEGNFDSSTSNSSLTQEVKVPKQPPRAPFKLGPKIYNWDEQRAAWLARYPHKRLTPQGRPHIILVTSSPPEPCLAATGDHFLLKSIKNKMDYCRLHMIDIYYNMAIMEMDDFWIKLPIIRKLMVSHPEAEWIWWMDSDAIFTDMTFDFPVEKYEGRNLVLHGWDKAVYEDKAWVGLNAGIFLLRNCQWSLDLLDMWAPLGEKYDNHKNEVGDFLSKELLGRPNFEVDDQAALVWLLYSKPELRPHVFLENSYHLHGWWVELTAHFDEMITKYHPGDGGSKWPFITHFVGCKFCAGKYNSSSLERCYYEVERAFNLADNQVLKPYGYQHESLSSVDVKKVSDEVTHPLERLGIRLTD
ncbi:hypothetical protein Mapa_005095 [Marchantia paleacea]|nr:hypothetical protein Mapa_005095 [Marchantia paleacea]